MPQASIVCPHCERKVNLQFTEVARSRDCPACGQTLMLQVTERMGEGKKRRALLVGGPLSEGETAASSPLAGQRQFTGRPLDRMRADPELRRARKRLKAGLISVAVLILLAVAWHLVPHAPPRAQAASAEPSGAGTAELDVPPPPGHDRMHLAPMLSRPLDFEKIVNARKKEMDGSRTGGE